MKTYAHVFYKLHPGHLVPAFTARLCTATCRPSQPQPLKALRPPSRSAAAARAANSSAAPRRRSMLTVRGQRVKPILEPKRMETEHFDSDVMSWRGHSMIFGILRILKWMIGKFARKPTQGMTMEYACSAIMGLLPVSLANLCVPCDTLWKHSDYGPVSNI